MESVLAWTSDRYMQEEWAKTWVCGTRALLLCPELACLVFMLLHVKGHSSLWAARAKSLLVAGCSRCHVLARWLANPMKMALVGQEGPGHDGCLLCLCPKQVQLDARRDPSQLCLCAV